METRWLEDFLVLADTGSFTRAAELRHLTQSAFSRRIKALESWLGLGLIDRTSYPTKLTDAGKLFREQANQILLQLNTTRAMLRGLQPLSVNTLEFVVPHTLSFSFFPKWLSAIEQELGNISCRLQASNVHDALLAFVEGGSDFLMCYHHPRQPVGLTDLRYQGLCLGVEHLRPFSLADQKGKPKYSLPGVSDKPLPFLGYANNAYFRLMSDFILEKSPEKANLYLWYETDMAEGLKQMVLEGHGLAFLPESAVAQEWQEQRLLPAGGDEWSVEMEVRLYWDQKRSRPEVRTFWEYLQQQYPQVLID